MGKKKILFVSPRYGKEVDGGAEVECRAYAEKLTDYYDVSVLTTCAKDHGTWKNEYRIGKQTINNVKVIRKPTLKQRREGSFGAAISKVTQRAHSDREEEQFIISQGPFCPQIIRYLKTHGEEYDAVIFITYLYYPTINGMKIKQLKNKILIPTLHDEWVAYLRIYREVFNSAKGIIYNTLEEKNLAEKMFPSIIGKPSCTCGYGIVTPRFESLPDVKQKYGLEDYILYAGRIEVEKGCNELFSFFGQYKDKAKSSLKLVLCGKEGIKIPERDDIIFLGFVSEEDKYALMKDAKVFVLPSRNESLSIVVLESLMMGTPVIVNGHCDVLKGHCIRSNAGLYYTDYTLFEKTLNWLLTHKDEYRQMQENGKAYVKANYQWDGITEKLAGIIEQTISSSGQA